MRDCVLKCRTPIRTAAIRNKTLIFEAKIRNRDPQIDEKIRNGAPEIEEKIKKNLADEKAPPPPFMELKTKFTPDASICDSGSPTALTI